MARTVPQQSEFDRIADEIASIEISPTISEAGMMDDEDDFTHVDPEAPEATVLRGSQVIYDADKVPLSANTTAEDKSEFKRMKAAFANQPRMTIVVPQNPPNMEQLPPEYVGINDYQFVIRRGEQVTVPRDVYLNLVQNGRIAPMRRQDHVHTPKHFYDMDRMIANMRNGVFA